MPKPSPLQGGGIVLQNADTIELWNTGYEYMLKDGNICICSKAKSFSHALFQGLWSMAVSANSHSKYAVDRLAIAQF